jgi:hypothetical protein
MGRDVVVRGPVVVLMIGMGLLTVDVVSPVVAHLMRFALRTNAGGRAQHGRRNRTPNGEHCCEQHQEPDTKRLHEQKGIRPR